MFKKKSIKVTVAGLIALLIAAVPLTVLAQEQEQEGERQGFVGTLTVTGGQYSLETPEGGTVEFSLADDLIVSQPPQGTVEADALVSGQKVAILAQQEEDGTWTALRVMIRPETPITEHLSGAVISREGNIITIMDPSGRQRQVELPEQAASGIEIGQPLTAVVSRGPGGETGPARGLGVVTSAEVRERLQTHVQRLQARAQAGQPDSDAAKRNIERVVGLLEANQARVVGVLQTAIDRVPQDVKETIQQVMTIVVQRFESARVTAAGVRDSVGPPSGVDQGGAGGQNQGRP